MTLELVIAGAVFLGVFAVATIVALRIASWNHATAEDRLDALAHSGGGEAADATSPPRNLLVSALKPEKDKALVQYLNRFFDVRLLLVQADVSASPSALVVATLALAVVGTLLGTIAPMALIVAPILAGIGGALPAVWVYFKRRRRLALFERQLPDALELLSRALRAGHSLTEGLHLVGEEMPAPSGEEFRRCFEQQNLGVKLQDALEEMVERVPSMDLRFFAISTTLQRQCGGDAAEIMDKIGRLIRQRFQVRGQISALTGEGRLSGIVLLALPILMGVYMYFRDPNYLRVLIEDPFGQKMLIGAIVAQVLGAICIKKIVDIKV
jgi:tight adherence protein B